MRASNANMVSLNVLIQERETLLSTLQHTLKHVFKWFSSSAFSGASKIKSNSSIECWNCGFESFNTWRRDTLQQNTLLKQKYRKVAGAPETSWPDGAYVTRRGCFKDFNSAHFVYRFLIRRILFSSSRSAEMLFWEIYLIYTLEGKEISKTLNIGQEFMKKIYFASTQPLLMTFTLLRLYHLC